MPELIDLVLDFETYFDREYALSKLTMQEYIESPLFETMGCSVILGHEPARWLDADELPSFFDSLDWDRVNLIGHNLLFDGGVLAHHYGRVPKLYSCTLSYSRAILGAQLPRCNLETVAGYFGMKKDTQALHNLLGMRFADVDRSGPDWDRYTTYAIQDAVQARTIYNMLMPHMPPAERVVVDVLIRMFVEGRLVLEPGLVEEAMLDAVTEASNKLAAAGMTNRSELRSRDKFATMLRNLGVEPPKKTSPANGLQTYAFAKTDLDFLELLEHPDQRVATLVDAKLNASSTIHESRAVRLMKIANLSADHRLQVPIAYSGAHTHRFCLVGYTQVVVLRGCEAKTISLDSLLPDDLVWDGEEFVAHGGLAYAGIKKVIEHDGIIGTPDHRVLVRNGQPGYLPLAAAKARGAHIARAGVPDPTRVDPALQRRQGGDGEVYLHLHELRQGDELALGGHEGSRAALVQVLRRTGADGGHHAIAGDAEGSAAREHQAGGVAQPLPPLPGRQGSLHSAEHPWLEELWRPRDRVSLRLTAGDGGVRPRDAGLPARGDVHRPGGQRGALRAGQPEVVDPQGAEWQPTWDIVDCGPRNRFAANGRIVHNSGLDKLNLQNLPRGSKLRQAIQAPKEHKLIVRDSSQIEARMLAFVAGQWDLVEQFANGEDVYASFAGSVYGKAINKRDHPDERFIGKTGILGLGYGSGAFTFHRMVMTSASPVSIDHDFALQVVGTYRKRYPQIVQLWRTAELILQAMASGSSVKFGPCYSELCRLTLPSGLALNYPGLELVPADERLHPDWGVEWRYYKPRYRAYANLFGAKLVENMIQALARIQITDTMVRMRVTNPDWHCALQVHDELVYLAPDDEAEACDEALSLYMNAQPKWAENSHIPLPLANEGGIADVYSEAKK